MSKSLVGFFAHLMIKSIKDLEVGIDSSEDDINCGDLEDVF